MKNGDVAERAVCAVPAAVGRRGRGGPVEYRAVDLAVRDGCLLDWRSPHAAREPWQLYESVPAASFFDALGRRLRLIVEGTLKKHMFVTVDGRCTLRLEFASNEPAEDDLRHALVRYLIRTGRSVPDESTFQYFTMAVARLIS